jgi:hypothetical protein
LLTLAASVIRPVICIGIIGSNLLEIAQWLMNALLQDFLDSADAGSISLAATPARKITSA